ncbi:MAG TPA: response regulator [Bryobacteraceae bacterium]|jgi:CheY-like chemotaxis protein
MAIPKVEPRETGTDRFPCVLVVDDDPSVRELLTDTLSEGGFTVLEAADGREAIHQIKGQHVDLVITDLVMPEQEGMETIRQIRREFPQIKVIAISGYQRGEYLYQAGLLGASATIRKPFSLDVVLETVAKVLES